MVAAHKLPKSPPAPASRELCPWVTVPESGRLTIEGRAILPDGYEPPGEWAGFTLTWRREGKAWHFRGEARGEPTALWVAQGAQLCAPHPVRVDHAAYTAPPRMMEGEGTRRVFLRVDEAGELVGVTLLEDDTEEVIPGVEAQAREVFGADLEFGPWIRNASGALEAAVSRREADDAAARDARDARDLADKHREARRYLRTDAPRASWLLASRDGMFALEGRAVVPAGFKPPTTFGTRGAITWTRGTDCWAFIATHEADTSETPDHDVVHEALWDAGLRAFRIDRATWIALADEAPLALAACGTRVTFDRLGRVCEVWRPYPDDEEMELADSSETLRATFGGALELGPWTRDDARAGSRGRGWTAKVLAWRGGVGEEGRTNTPAGLCPWLVDPDHGALTIRGRARLPDGRVPPTETSAEPLVLDDDPRTGAMITTGPMPVGTFTWEGDNFTVRWPHFPRRLLSHADDVVANAFFEEGDANLRIDAITLESPAELADRQFIDGHSGYVISRGGRPVQVETDAWDEGERERVRSGFRHVFGGFAELGPWAKSDRTSRGSPVYVAEVRIVGGGS